MKLWAMAFLNVNLLIAVILLTAGFGQRPVLPTGFTIQHADGITYVCSIHPVYCTGNKP